MLFILTDPTGVDRIVNVIGLADILTVKEQLDEGITAM